MADFRDVVSVLPCSPTNKGKKNLCAEKANRQWAFVAVIVIVCGARNIKTAAAFANWLAPKKGYFSVYFFGSFCVYYIPHDYVIPQPMLHAIPQTLSISYSHSTLPTMHCRSQHCWELLHLFAHHCQHGRSNSQHTLPPPVPRHVSPSPFSVLRPSAFAKSRFS